MKKISYIVTALAAMTLAVSCNKNNTPEMPDHVTVNIQIAEFDSSPETKAVKTNWAVGDKINIWFGDAYWSVVPQLVLTKTTDGWTASEVDVNLLSSEGTFKAAYEGTNSLFASARNYSQMDFPMNGTSFKLTEWGTSNATCTKVPVACYANQVAYTYESSTKTLSATISSWVMMSRIQFVVTGLVTSDPDRYAMTGDTHIRRLQGFEIDSNNNIFDSGELTCNGISGKQWINGDTNEDGLAFRFRGSNLPKNTPADITMYLVDKQAKKVYSASSNTVFTHSGCHSFKLDISKFTDITSTHPFASE